MMYNITIRRVAVHLTWRCTLRCEKCGAFIPESYERGLDFDYDYDDVRLSLATLFDMSNRIDVITLTGGEAILHKDIVELCEYLYGNKSKFGRLDFQTNGNTLFSEGLLKVMAKSDKFYFFIDHYGPGISTKVEQNVVLCEEMGVRYRVRNYYGEDAYLNGWIDWSPRKNKIDIETAKKQFSFCANGREASRPLVLYGNELTLCAMPFCRYRIGAQPKEDVLLLDLLDNKLSMDEKKERLYNMVNAEVNPGCMYCYGIGVNPNAERFKAGEQKQTHKKLIQLIEQINPYVEVDGNTRLLDDGVLDSMAIFAFVTLLEDTYDIEIPDDEITREKFATVEKISSMIHTLTKRGEGIDR